MDLHAQLLQRDAHLPETARASVAQIRSEARQLGRMIMNLLDLSKGDEGKLVPKPSQVDLRALVESVQGDLEVSAQGRHVSVASRIDVQFVSADEDLLRRALANLVENAIRHSPSGGLVSITVAASGDAVEIRVADTGTGVPAELRVRVFDPFLQVESGDRPVNLGGRGLGLAFCRLAVEAHGGRIWVEDAAPGAVFCLRLPA